MSRALTEKEIAWARVLSAVSEDYVAHTLQPGTPPTTREEFIIPWAREGRGRRLVETWLAASAQPAAEPATVKQLAEQCGERAAEAIRKAKPELTHAAAVSEFLKTAQGRALYAAAHAVPADALVSNRKAAATAKSVLYRTLGLDEWVEGDIVKCLNGDGARAFVVGLRTQ